MIGRLRPSDAAELREIVRAALDDDEPLEIISGATKRGLGRPPQGTPLDLARLDGLVSYEPEELILRVRAATPMVAIESWLEQAGQNLAFEPPDLGPFYDHPAGRQTIGGVIATNLSGPRRIKAGAARDHFLGFSAVNGRGEDFKAGGHVVKNVTGYDLCKLLAGSYGTLAILTEITLKALPAPEDVRTLALAGLSAADAVRAMGRAFASPFDASAAAHVPVNLAARLDGLAGQSWTFVRFEGPEQALRAATDTVARDLAAYGVAEILDAAASVGLWRAVRDIVPLFPADGSCVWRATVPPARGAEVVAAITARLGVEWYLDWAGGRIWLRVLDGGADGGAEIVRGAVGAWGGHAVLMRGSEAIRLKAAPLDPASAGALALSRRIKQGFDPKAIFNRGRMYDGV
ncbi:MAG: glycolate oxidase subunit GlcE [Alphaproteobacteria bacterium]